MTATDTSTPTTAGPRLDLVRPWPAGYRAMAAFGRAVADESPLTPALRHLVKLRASQVNGCAFCLDLHAGEARGAGEDQRRLDVLPAWREVDLFTERERAALALAESITLLSESHVPDDVLDEAQRHFAPDEMAALVFEVVVINAWNRISVTARTPLPPAGG
ncbi:MAG TPA: carboxymuconolactone decarboxylase family protein [Acidimicrobiales bacterium]|nr:carboxymuconolactone decarboxylase family protein [Acidimicrobiales bacterium]